MLHLVETDRTYPPETIAIMTAAFDSVCQSLSTRIKGNQTAQELLALVPPVPHGHWKTSTFVAGLRTGGLTAPLVIDGAMNGEVFLAYVEQILVPTLSPAISSF